jgi:hypothetical protein
MRVRLLRSLPSRYKVDIMIQEGTHQSENAGEWFASKLRQANIEHTYQLINNLMIRSV